MGGGRNKDQRRYREEEGGGVTKDSRGRESSTYGKSKSKIIGDKTGMASSEPNGKNEILKSSQKNKYGER